MEQTIILKYVDPGTGFVVFNAGAWLIALLLGFFGFFSLLFKKIFNFFKKFKKVSFAIFALILIMLITGVAMTNLKKTNFDKKVIILGFDGLSPVIAERMMQEGKLPNFSRLKESGAYQHLSTTNPAQSPVAWSGFSTGQNPGKNGVFDFIIRNPKNYALSLSLSEMENGKPKRVIKSRAFWQYASAKKVPVVILSCPVTFPADKVYGRQLSGMGVPDILGTEGTFTYYTSESIGRGQDIGGKVFHVNKSKLMVMQLIGPKVSNRGKIDNTKIPFKVSAQGKNSIEIGYQNHKINLKAGEYSDWMEVTFNLGLFRKAKGIFKFYLVSAEPEFKLYISPINLDPREPFFHISYPENYSKELADNLGLYYTQGMPMDTWAVNEGRLTEKPFLEQVNALFNEKNKQLNFELGRFKKGILYCYFEMPDTIQHMFWRYVDTAHPLYEKDAPKEYKDMIETWYKKMDGVLGRVLQKMGKEDTLIALSDHGFAAFRRAAHVNSWLKENGYLKLKNPYADSGAELLEDIDWPKTQAYAIGFGAIYINQYGRERDGIVKPGAATEALKDEISRKLKNWFDEKYKQPVISKVYKREEIFWGREADKAPDLYIGFNLGYRASWQTALGAAPEGLIEDNLKKWSGDHLFDPQLIPGVIFSNKKFSKEKPSIYDIAPTVLKIIGFTKNDLEKCDFDGQPL